jgi:FkbM family methyltransferase
VKDDALGTLILSLPARLQDHVPTTDEYARLKLLARRHVESMFANRNDQSRVFPPFGRIQFPYFKMGVTDSLNLFDLDELIIFSFYWVNRHRYKRVADIGANIGLHSVVLSKCGFAVRAYEPDPVHFDVLQQNLSANYCSNVEVFNTAISSKRGVFEFVRVMGNTTGSHIAGSKPNPYGELQRFSVAGESIHRVLGWPDLIKMDVEGHEREILLETRREHWSHMDALIEIGSEANAAAVFEHLNDLKLHLFSQKAQWRKVEDVADMPFSYRDGTLFVTGRSEMNWR